MTSSTGTRGLTVSALPPVSDSRSSSLGDMKWIASYQGLLPEHNFGVQLGLKLPTGQYGTDVKFRSGPAAGLPLDASLQPGTGSTDIIVGAYYYRAVGHSFDAFANVQYQSAVTSKQSQPGNDFRPGNSTSVTVGVRYEQDPHWVPQLQLNLLHKNVDRGAKARRSLCLRPTRRTRRPRNSSEKSRRPPACLGSHLDIAFAISKISTTPIRKIARVLGSVHALRSDERSVHPP